MDDTPTASRNAVDMKPNPSTPTFSTLTTSAAISRCTIVAVLAGAAVVSAEPPQSPAAVKLAVRETVLAEIPEDVEWKSVVISRDAAHVAYVRSKDNSSFVVLDGVPQSKSYPSIGATSIRFSPDGKQLAYVVSTGPPILTALDFAQQTQRLHFSFTTSLIDPLVTAVRVVVGATEGPTLSHIDANSMVFSPDGKRFGYVARRNERWRVVIDGNEQSGEYDDVAPYGQGPTIHFSPDSKRVAYVGLRREADSSPLGYRFHRFVVVDGNKGKEYDEVGYGASLHDSIVFSPDSKQVAFVAATRNGKETRMFPVIDGVEGDSKKGIRWLDYTPDGGRMVMMTFREQPEPGVLTRMAVSVAGMPAKEYTQLRAPVYLSPDGSRIAFVNLPLARRSEGSKASVVVDNTEG
ncbi:MAG: hypothetical protein ACOVT5_04710, partial [Armatimonadaceae bacterium]